MLALVLKRRFEYELVLFYAVDILDSLEPRLHQPNRSRSENEIIDCF